MGLIQEIPSMTEPEKMAVRNSNGPYLDNTKMNLGTTLYHNSSGLQITAGMNVPLLDDTSNYTHLVFDLECGTSAGRRIQTTEASGTVCFTATNLTNAPSTSAYHEIYEAILSVGTNNITVSSFRRIHVSGNTPYSPGYNENNTAASWTIYRIVGLNLCAEVDGEPAEPYLAQLITETQTAANYAHDYGLYANIQGDYAKAQAGAAQTATDNANNAAQAAQTISDTVQTKLDNGDFIGEKGDKGDPGEVTLEQLNTALADKADKSSLTETNLRIATVDKSLSDYCNAISSINPNQEAKQTASGYGTVSLPVNAANGQVSCTVGGNTVTDESGTNSTVSAGRLRSFNKNLVGYNNSLPYTSTGVTMTYSDGKYTLTGTSTGYPFKSIFTIPANTLKGTYRLSKTTISGTDTAYIRIIDRTVTPAVPYSESVYATPFTMNGIHNELQVEIACTAGVTYNESFYLQLEPGTTATSYEPYTTADQYYPDCGILQSVGTANDEVSFNQQTGQWEWIKRNGVKTNVASGTVINYADMATGGEFIAYYADGATQTGVKGDTLTALAVELTYQLASPIVTPIDVTGTLVGYPKGTLYWEPVLPVAGVYTSTGIAITNTSFPIESIESISKIDFVTGLETEVDISKAVIAVDGLSFTHPDLTADDIVFFTYFHGVEGTQPKIDVEYYDSRYVLKDSVTGKFYKIVETVANATLTRTLVEV